MQRSHIVAKPALLYRGEDDTETEIEVEVRGFVTPYFAGNWEEPPDGGVEDVRAIFYDGKKQREIELLDSEVNQFGDLLAEADMDEPDEPDEDDCYDAD